MGCWHVTILWARSPECSTKPANLRARVWLLTMVWWQAYGHSNTITHWPQNRDVAWECHGASNYKANILTFNSHFMQCLCKSSKMPWLPDYKYYQHWKQTGPLLAVWPNVWTPIWTKSEVCLVLPLVDTYQHINMKTPPHILTLHQRLSKWL